MADSLADVIERLFRGFENQFSLAEIAAVVRECRSQLCCSPPQALPELVDRLAQQRLSLLRRTPGAAATLASAAR